MDTLSEYNDFGNGKLIYRDVVKKAQKTVKARGFGPLGLHADETWLNGDQINLWSYWQGYQINDIDKGIDFLLVGQDWGNPDKPENAKLINVIKNIQAGNRKEEYIAESPTDKRLIELFKCLECKIKERNPGKRILFTNYSLGYRSNVSESGGMCKKLLKLDTELFADLVRAVKPKKIICLGKDVYELVSGRCVTGFVKQLRSGKPFISAYPDDDRIKVYGVAHCGNWGANNVGGIETMKKIWKKIAEDRD